MSLKLVSNNTTPPKEPTDLITVEQFIEAVGRPPQQDDLERCNCPKAGQPGHWQCGWHKDANLPVFMVPLGRYVK